MPQTPLLYGFDPLAVLLGGLLGPPAPAFPLETAGAVARPLLYGFDPFVTLLDTLTQPLLPAVDFSAGIRATFKVAGTLAAGSEGLTAEVIGDDPVLGSLERKQVFKVIVSPWLSSAETVLDVTPLVNEVGLDASTVDVTARMVSALSILANDIYVALSSPIAPLRYQLTLAVETAARTTMVVCPYIACPA